MISGKELKNKKINKQKKMDKHDFFVLLNRHSEELVFNDNDTVTLYYHYEDAEVAKALDKSIRIEPVNIVISNKKVIKKCGLRIEMRYGELEQKISFKGEM